LKRGIAEGGPREAAIRAALYIRMPEGVADERGFRLLQRLHEEAGAGLTLASFDKAVREQFLSLLLDERRAVEAIPTMLAKDQELASRMATALGRLIEVVGVDTAVGKSRLREMEKLFREKPRLVGTRDLKQLNVQADEDVEKQPRRQARRVSSDT
jgi:hypothetical protein